MRLIGRLSIVVVAVAAAAWAAWHFLLQRQDVQLDLFERNAKARWAAAAPKPADASAFRATVCAASPCVLVEAGGLAFLVGAGAGAAEGLAARGLLRADLDGVVLTDLRLGTVEGLPGIQQASFARGRADPTPVYGPDGVLTVVDGANLMLSGSRGEGSRLQVGVEGEDQGLEGKVVFDSGVVAIRAFATTGGPGRVYRFDFGGKALIVGGCTARPADVLGAARGTKVAAAILAAQSARMLEIERAAARGARAVDTAAPGCMASEVAIRAAAEARLAAGLLAPLTPAPVDAPSRRAWREILAPPAGLALAPAEPGAVLDLSGEKPALDLPK